MPGYHVDRRAVLARGLKLARQRRGLSATSASEALVGRGLRCKRATLLAWERGRGDTSREPYASDLAVIASVYGCTVNDLFRQTQENAGFAAVHVA